MKKQGYNACLDEHLGMRAKNRSGKMKQNFKDRRHESEGMKKHYGKRKYSSVRSMDHERWESPMQERREHRR